MGDCCFGESALAVVAIAGYIAQGVCGADDVALNKLIVFGGLGQQDPGFLVIAFGLEKFIGCVIGVAGGMLVFHSGIVPLRRGQRGLFQF